MKAYVLKEIGKIEFEEVPIPEPNENEVLVRVEAAGICGSDIPRIYQNGAHVHPIIPGHEFAGVVEKTGKRVGVFPLIPCMNCPECNEKKYEMCRNYSYLGSRRDGAFAEYVSVPVNNLIEIPDNVSFETAAMLEPLSVAMHAIRGLVGDDGDRNSFVGIWGLGTIGMMLTSILKAEGYNNLYCVINKDFQSEVLTKEIGISTDKIINVEKCDAITEIMEKTDNHGFDYGFECVGRNETAVSLVKCAASSGKIMLVGNPYSNMKFEKDDYWRILRKQLTVKGTWNSSYTGGADDDWHRVLSLLEKGQLKTDFLVTQKYNLKDIGNGFLTMRDKTKNYLKCMYVREN